MRRDGLVDYPNIPIDTQNYIDQLPAGIFRCQNDADFKILDYNNGFERLFGYSQEEIRTWFHGKYSEMIIGAEKRTIINEIRDQLKRQAIFELEYQVCRKDGTAIWVLDRGRLQADGDGKKTIARILINVTEMHQVREDLRLSLERHKIILNQSTDIIFDWDIKKDTLTYSPNWGIKFGYEPIREQISVRFPESSHIHPEDRIMIQNMMDSLRNGNSCPVGEIRIQTGAGQYLWCRIRATDQYDYFGSPIRAVGAITDIDEEKRMIEHLRKKAEQDALTGLYNKAETSTLIEQYLSTCPEEEICALLIIDIDDFKLANDTLGHLFGDTVLSEAASAIKDQLHTTDIIGRIGGDEFAIFLKSLPSQEDAGQKAEELIDCLHALFANDKKGFCVNCSIGISIFPHDAKDYQQLFSCADNALYFAKGEGKNRYSYYDPYRMVESQEKSCLGSAIDSEHSMSGNGCNLFSYLFQILYTADDLDAALSLIMEIVGKRFNVSRVYIFENSPDNRYMSNTFEWCNTGVKPEKENLQNLDLSVIGDYKSNFGTDDVLYCHNLNTLPSNQARMLQTQDIQSMLQCAIRERGGFRGFVGFDECTGLRLWTQEEISALSVISQLIATFLLKKRAQDRVHNSNRRLHAILDNQDAFIYAVDPKTHELLYLNKKTRFLDPSVQLGIPCHKAFYGLEHPCSHCPVKNLALPESGRRKEFFNPRYQLWVSSYASPIKWDNREACLITCYDITQYVLNESQYHDRALPHNETEQDV